MRFKNVDKTFFRIFHLFLWFPIRFIPLWVFRGAVLGKRVRIFFPFPLSPLYLRYSHLSTGTRSFMTDHSLVLASASPARLALLEAVGVSCSVRPSFLDEDAVKRELREKPVFERAAVLAEKKALAVSAVFGEALVIGADQMLECDGVFFDKPGDRMQAARQLKQLRGKSHRLVSAAVVVQSGQKIWETVDDATLVMRSFSDDFLERYLDDEEAAILSSVGAYRLEGRGAQLFTSIRGDYFTILGLPLLPLLEFLRSRGVLIS